MWSLLVGLTGMLVVGVTGGRAVRACRSADERLFHVHHNVTFLLTFLCFNVVPGILSLFGVIDDPLFGPGPTYAPLTALLGVAGVAVLVACCAVAVRRNTVPARRVFLVRFHAYLAASFLAFFTLPGLLADLGVTRDAMLGLGASADALFLFFLLRWAERESARFRPADPTAAPAR